jgi:hypothetical protein
MSYGATAALQQAVFARLTSDPAVTALVGSHIYDALPEGPVPEMYLSIGPEAVRDRSDKTGSGALHDFAVTVISDAAGFSTAKQVAAAASDALTGGGIALSRGVLVSLNFLRARARRVGSGRQIEIWFRARVDDEIA